MKKYFALLLPVVFTLSTYAKSPAIDDRLVNSFNILFPAAQNIRWDETPDTYVVHFTDEGIRSRAVFNKQRSDFYFTRYYTGDRLPSAIRIKLRKDHPFKKVTGVTEISHYSAKGRPLHTEYYLNLEDNYRLLNVKVKKNGRMEVINSFIKMTPR
jgi:hypothetical protein